MSRCIYHCAICGQHFRGIGLFDKHLDRNHRESGQSNAKRSTNCLACRLNVPHEYRHRTRLNAGQVEGVCNLSGPEIVPAKVLHKMPAFAL